MKKIYTIKVSETGGGGKFDNRWYNGKEGKIYDAELAIRGSSVAFKISDALYMPPTRCTVISERLEEKYIK